VNGVSTLHIRWQFARCRRHLTALIAVLALCGAVALHHDGMAMGGMGGHDMSVALDICLGVMSAVGTAVIAVAFGLLSLARLRLAWIQIPAGPVVRSRPPVPRARAGPPLLCLLCVSRR